MLNDNTMKRYEVTYRTTSEKAVLTLEVEAVSRSQGIGKFFLAVGKDVKILRVRRTDKHEKDHR